MRKIENCEKFWKSRNWDKLVSVEGFKQELRCWWDCNNQTTNIFSSFATSWELKFFWFFWMFVTQPRNYVCLGDLVGLIWIGFSCSRRLFQLSTLQPSNIHFATSGNYNLFWWFMNIKRGWPAGNGKLHSNSKQKKDFEIN